MEYDLSSAISTLATSLEMAVESAIAGQMKGIIALVFFLLAFANLYSLLMQLRMRRWPATRGTLLVSETTEFGATEYEPSHVDYINSVAYTYTVGNKSYTGNRLSPWVLTATHNLKFLLQRRLHGLTAGGNVEVFYDPGHPGRAYLRRPGVVGMLVTLAFAVFCVATPVLVFKP